METGVGRKQLLLLIALLLAIRIPFLNQAIQGDDDIYLKEAAHALVEPLQPANTKYVFRGDPVDLRGHSHPPGNAWPLAALIAVSGSVKEVPFHAAYIAFSLIAVASMWSLARRFSPQPVWAALLFMAVPAFVVNGASLEADLPFLAFWMASCALFISGRLPLAAAAMACSAMFAYQAVMLIPILAVYTWIFHRRSRVHWLVLLVPIATILAWQAWSRAASGTMPAAVLSGYFTKYGFQKLQEKLASALMLAIHSWFIVFPALVPPAAILAWRRRREPETAFLLAWITLYFAGAAAMFFAGSARYLLPMAAPVALLASRLHRRWCAAGFGLQMALSLGLAAANYQHWDAYRTFIPGQPRMWVNGEWGLRHYLEEGGALPLEENQPLRAGDFIVTSELGRAVAEVSAPTVLLRRMEIRPSIPLRIIGLESRSGYSSKGAGFWPFGMSNGVVDRVTVHKVIERQITREYLPMNAPEAVDQLVRGFFPLEDNRFRWMERRGEVVLKRPAAPAPLSLAFDIPAPALARKITLLLDGKEVASQQYPGPGHYTLSTPPLTGTLVTIEADKSFTAPGDSRELAIVVTGIGFRP